MQQNSHLALIPLKPFNEAKQRLRGSLEPAERADLARSMASHVVGTVTRILPTAVISRDETALDLATELGAVPLRETPAILNAGNDSLNAALAHGAAWASSRGYAQLVIIAGDLPLLTVDDIHAMIESPRPASIKIAGDTARTGTNALCIAPPDLIRFRFGTASFEAHTREARRVDAPIIEVKRRGLAVDIDTGADLDRLAVDRLEARK